MKIRLLKDSRVMVKAGEVIEVSPAEAAFLLSLKMAEAVEEKAAPKTRKKKSEE